MSDGSAFQARGPAMENALSSYMKPGTWNNEVAAHTGPVFYLDTLGLGEIASIGGEMLGVWGLCPQRGPGAESLVRGSGGQSPLEAGSFLLHK